MTPENSDKIIFDFLSAKHTETGSDFDALDTKFAQIITLNGVILSITLLSGKGNYVGIPLIFDLGIFTILSSTLIALWKYCPKDYDEGLGYFSQDPFPFNRPMDPKKPCYELNPLFDLKKSNRILLSSTIRNMNILDKKADWFQYVLITLFVGLILLIAGFYL